VAEEVLDRRALNRALLARQLLLERRPLGALDAIEAVGGMQAQAPRAPYVGLWSRIEGFDPGALEALVREGEVVRTWLMRATVHLVSARDARAWGRSFAEVRRRRWTASAFAKLLDERDVAEAAEAVAELVAQAPRTRAELRDALRERLPGRDAEALGYVAAYHCFVAQAPPRGLWTEGGPAKLAPLEVDRGDGAAAEEVLRRGLAAIGPATPADLATWSGMSGVAAALERLGDDVVALSDDRGRTLFDLRDAPRPPGDTPAPPRFLPEYDNTLLSHADRARVIDVERRVPLPPGNGGTAGTLLVDGFWRAEWKLDREGVLRIARFAPWPREHDDAVTTEAAALTAFLQGKDHDLSDA